MSGLQPLPAGHDLEPRAGARAPAPAGPGALEVYLDRRVFAILLLGFAGGLPLLLVLRTLSAWLAEDGIDTATIGLFGFAMAPYTLEVCLGAADGPAAAAGADRAPSAAGAAGCC